MKMRESKKEEGTIRDERETEGENEDGGRRECVL